MILVAATGVGLAWARYNYEWDGRPPPFWDAARSVYKRAALVIAVGLLEVLPLLFAWTLAVLTIRLRRPRPRLRVLLRQPGFVASLSATLALLLCGLTLIPDLASGNKPAPLRWYLVNFTPEPAFAVFGAWFTLAANRRWRPEPSWIDRLGRLLGIAWFLSNAANAARVVLYSW